MQDDPIVERAKPTRPASTMTRRRSFRISSGRSARAGEPLSRALRGGSASLLASAVKMRPPEGEERAVYSSPDPVS